MSRLFELIDSQPTQLGEISLRRRRIPAFGDNDIYEVKLGDEYLMSSMFVDAEVALADLGLAALDGEHLNVVVGGLGLGYTAQAALKDARVDELLVIEYLAEVIGWHEQERVPVGKALNADTRCRFIHGSFFELALSKGSSFDPRNPGRLFDAILLDIDHSPSAFLNASNAHFYTAGNLKAMSSQLRPDGVFAMWSNDPPDQRFLALLSEVFADVEARVVPFYNPLQNNEATNTVYIGVHRPEKGL